MKSILRQLVGLLSGTMLLMLGIGTLGTLIPVRLTEADFSTTSIGVVSSGYFLGLIIGAYTGQRTIAAVGHIRAFVTFTSLLSAATLLHPFVVAATPWFVLRIIEGACMSGLAMCIETWLNQVSTDRVRGRVLSIYMVILYLSQGVGQAFLTVPDVTGFGLFVIASVLLSLAALPVAAARVIAPRRPRRRPIALRGIIRASPSAASASFSSGLALGAFYGLAPVFTGGIGLDLAATAAFMGVTIIGGVVLQYPLGWASDRFERRSVIALLGAGLAVVCAGLALSSELAPGAVLWLAPAFGGIIFAIYPLSVAQANDRITPDDRIVVAGSILIAYGIGAVLGPLIAAAAIEVVGPSGLFMFVGSVGVLVSAVALIRKGVREAASEEEKVPFMPVPRTTVVVDTLDPRTDVPADPPGATGAELSSGSLPEAAAGATAEDSRPEAASNGERRDSLAANVVRPTG